MLPHPSKYDLGDKGARAHKADGDAEDAYLREFTRNSPTRIPCFKDDTSAYMKFFFESVGPEELVLVSFHD